MLLILLLAGFSAGSLSVSDACAVKQASPDGWLFLLLSLLALDLGLQRFRGRTVSLGWGDLLRPLVGVDSLLLSDCLR